MKTTTAQAIVAVATLGSITVLATVHAWIVLVVALLFGLLTMAALSGAEDRRQQAAQKAAVQQHALSLIAELEQQRRDQPAGGDQA